MISQIHPCAGLLATAARLISGAQARWFNCEPESRQRIYFANHTSHLDPLVLWAALPPEIRAVTRPVAARDYWSRDKVRRYIASRIFHAVLIDRCEHTLGGHAILEALHDALDRGASLILFPEGTRGNGDGLAPFKGGLYYLCKLKPDLEAVPVCLENLNRVLPKGEFLPVPLLSRVTFGPPIQPAGTEDKDAFLDRARDAVRQLRNL